MANSVKMPNDMVAKMRTAPAAGAAPGMTRGINQGDASSDDAFSGVLNSVTGNRGVTKAATVTRDAAAISSKSQTNGSVREASRDAKDSQASSRAADKSDSSASTATGQADDNTAVRNNARRDTSRQDAARQQDRDDASAAGATAASQSNSATEPRDDDRATDTTTATLAESAAELLLMMGVGQTAPVTADKTPAVANTEAGQDMAATAVISRPTAATAPAASNAGVTAGAVIDQDKKQPAVVGTHADAKSVFATTTGSQKDTALSGMATFIAQMTNKSEQKEARPADVLTNAANLLAAIGNSGGAAGTQSVKDVAAALQSNQLSLNERVGTPAWTHELGSKLVVLSKQDVSAATLHITPADLGPMRVHIETQQNQANVWFAADHPDTRSAIEQSLPRLREMFVAQGMQLNDAGVSGQSAQQQSAATPSAWRNAAETGEMETPDTVTVRTLSLKLVDAYA